MKIKKIKNSNCYTLLYIKEKKAKKQKYLLLLARLKSNNLNKT